MPRVGLLVAGALIVAGSIAHADVGTSPTVTDCAALQGWWIGPNGQRMFKVEGHYLQPGTIPANPLAAGCGGVPFGSTPFYSMCVVDWVQPCAHRLQVVFISTTFGILSAQRGTQPTCTPCLVWDAITVHPESVPAASVSWGHLKRLFR